MEYDVIDFNSLPQKAKQRIFVSFNQERREHLRTVCKSWNQFIIKEFPVQLVITNANFERLFRCSRASKVTLTNLTAEYAGEIAFSRNLKALVSIRKTLTCNLKRICIACNNLESLSFASLEQVVGVEEEGLIQLPKVTSIEIKVRGDQETFTSDETIIINLLRKVQFGSLENILISVKSALDWIAELHEDSSAVSQDITLTDWASRDTTVASFDLSDDSSGPISLQLHPSIVTRLGNTGQDLAPIMLDESTSEQNETSRVFIPLINAPALEQREAVVPAATPRPPPTINVPSADRSLRHVANTRSIGLGVDSSAAVSGADLAYYQPGMSQFDLIARFFNGRIHAQIQDSGSNLEAILSDPRSRAEFLRGIDFSDSERTSLDGPSPLLELLKNNSKTIKSLVVKAKPEFMCFGNMSAALDLRPVQFQEIEYSFGRSQLCMEYPLLQVQHQLVKVTLQIFDDLWDSLMIAAQQSKETLKEMDLKILSLSHDPLDLINLSSCSNLIMLKIFHYYEKRSLGTLPTSLTRLALNGPLGINEMETLANRLKNLQELTIIANLQGGRIDLRLFKKLVSMPKISKMILIQCQVDVEDIVKFCAEHETQLTAKILGPTTIPDGDILGSLIQFVVINIAQPLPITSTQK